MTISRKGVFVPRPKAPPRYSHHRPSGQARTRINGEDIYLGPHDSPESHDRFNELRREWLASQAVDKFTMNVATLCIKYLKHVDRYYVKNGEPTSEPHNIRIALRYLIETKGTTNARRFGPKALISVRDAMIAAKCVRTSINRMIGRVKRAFKWGVTQEFLQPELLVGLDAVEGLQAERSDAIESEPVGAVEVVHVYAIQPHVTRQIWGMVQLQLHSAASPGEIRIMRTCDITPNGDPQATYNIVIDPNAIAKFGVLTEAVQVEAAIALAQVSRNGLHTHTQRLAAAEYEYREDLQSQISEFHRDYRNRIVVIRSVPEV